VAHALAAVHTEFILIHPFREGNGRVGRMLAIVMAAQAGYPALDFGHLKGMKKQEYFRAVKAGNGLQFRTDGEDFQRCDRADGAGWCFPLIFFAFTATPRARAAAA